MKNTTQARVQIKGIGTFCADCVTHRSSSNGLRETWLECSNISTADIRIARLAFEAGDGDCRVECVKSGKLLASFSAIVQEIQGMSLILCFAGAPEFLDPAL